MFRCGTWLYPNWRNESVVTNKKNMKLHFQLHQVLLFSLLFFPYFCLISLYVAGICEDMEESAKIFQPVVDVLIVGAGTKNSHPSNVRPSLAYE
jgi:hypothetical protein